MESSGTGTVIEPLLALEREDGTGTLEFRARDVATRIYVRAGEIAFAEGGALGETLGRILVRLGRLTESQVSVIIHRMVDALVGNDRVRFGEIAIEYGFLTPDELTLALTQQVKEKLIGCVHRGSGAWRFMKDDPHLDAVGSYVVATRPMLVDAALQLPERRAEEILCLGENRFPEIVAPEEVIAAEFDLSPDESGTLKELDGTSSLQFILSTVSAVNVMPLVTALALGGGIELRRAPASKRLPSDRRPIPPAFRTRRRERYSSEAETIALPRRPVKADARDPDASPHSFSTVAVAMPARRPPSRDSLPNMTNEARVRAGHAEERLRAELDARTPLSARRRWPDPKNGSERRLMAEAAHQKGLELLRAENIEGAAAAFQRATELRPQEREYELYVKWAQLPVLEGFREVPVRGTAREVAERLVREDRNCALAFSILGYCTHQENAAIAALRFFQRAATLDPTLQDAVAFADMLAPQVVDSEARSPRAETFGAARRGDLPVTLDEIIPAPLPKPPVLPNEQTRKVKPVKTQAQSWQAGFGPMTSRTGVELDPDAPPPDRTLEGPPVRNPTTAPVIPALPPLSESTVVMSTDALPPRRPDASMSPEPPPVHAPIVPDGTHRIAPIPSGAVPLIAPPVMPPPGRSPRMPKHVSAPPPGITHGQSGRPPEDVGPVVTPDSTQTPAPRRTGLFLFLVLLTFGGAAVAAYFVGPRFVPHRRPITTASQPTIASAPPPSASSAPHPLASVVPSAAPSARAGDAGPAEKDAGTTGTLHTRGAYGRRIFIDGHSVGEGGRDLTVPCGTHRLRVGSAGTERSVTIPCGGTVDLE